MECEASRSDFTHYLNLSADNWIPHTIHLCEELKILRAFLDYHGI